MNEYLRQPVILVIFGITGDLAQRKLLPALYHLLEREELPEHFEVVGVSRQQLDTNAVYAGLEQHITSGAYNPLTAERLRGATRMIQMDLDDPAAYRQLHDQLRVMSGELPPGAVRLYYLSIPAQAFKQVVHRLGEAGHHEPFSSDAERPRLLVEKPFGYDMDSARQLVAAADERFGEQQTFRIDHYLAKETAQNILTFRFHNPLFQSIWNARHIEGITISALETIGIENRAVFYEQTGALRDILQSHLLQLLALITMEKPAQLESADIHRAKLRLLDSVLPIETSAVPIVAVRGQYEGYRHEVGNARSHVETFARLRLTIDNEQWRSVPVIVQTGKALHEKCTEIVVQFRASSDAPGVNTLTFRIQPREGIALLLQAKRPGVNKETDEVEMDFDYHKTFHVPLSEAYERVIIDAVRGDQSLFASAAEVLASWRIVEDVLSVWEKSADGLVLYRSARHRKILPHRPDYELTAEPLVLFMQGAYNTF